MTDTLDKLTKKIYDEGVAKANDEAKKILEHAEQEKRKMLRMARQEAEDIVGLARTEAAELKNRVESELRMSSRQALALLRQKIVELISEKVAVSSTQGIFEDSKFLKRIIELVMKEWLAANCQVGQQFYLRLPPTLQQEIKDYFFERGKRELDHGLKIEFDDKIKSGFVIAPTNGAYRIGFTEDDFRALIQYFLRPEMSQFLFGGKKGDE